MNRDYHEYYYQAIIWPGIDLRLLRALHETTTEDGGIPVQLGYEPDNLADSQAVMITLNTWSLRRLLGADLVRIPASRTDHQRTEYWRLGYIRRTDQSKETLWQSLQQQDTPLDARLMLDGHDWLVRVCERRVSQTQPTEEPGDDQETPINKALQQFPASGK